MQPYSQSMDWSWGETNCQALQKRSDAVAKHICLIRFSLCLLSAADSFKHKEFFAKVGLSAKSAEQIKEAFYVIDQDKSGFIEEEELK